MSSNALVPTNGNSSGALAVSRTRYEPQSLDQGLQLARRISNTRLVPSQLHGKPDDVFLVMAQGAELGLTTMQALRSLYVVNGRVTMSADMMVALCLRSSECEYFRCVEQSPEGATWETKRRGSKPERRSFTMEDGQRAGVVGKDNWKAWPGRMCSARAKSFLARDVFPDIIGGFFTPDEIRPGAVPEVDPGNAIDVEVQPAEWSDPASGVHQAPPPSNERTGITPVEPQAPVSNGRAQAAESSGRIAARLGIGGADETEARRIAYRGHLKPALAELFPGGNLDELSAQDVRRAESRALYLTVRESAVLDLMESYPDHYLAERHAENSLDKRTRDVGPFPTADDVRAAYRNVCATRDAEAEMARAAEAEKASPEDIARLVETISSGSMPCVEDEPEAEEDAIEHARRGA